jgi:Bacterial SH3 domain
MKKLMTAAAMMLSATAAATATEVVIIRGSGNECVVADPTGTPLNVRNRPNGAILGALHNDTRVVVTDSAIASGKVWSKVVPVEAGKVGWVFRSYLDCA